MAPPLLTLKDIALSFGSTPLLERADMMIEARERLCVVGRNGCGKSTLLKIAAGLIEADHGERFIKPGTTIRYLEQSPDLSAHPTLVSYIEAGLEGAQSAARVPYLLDALNLNADQNPTHISGGEARRAALARVLAAEPDILLLDEPTNHLDLPIIEWLENELGRFKGALVLISHDRAFLSKLSRKTLWVDRGETRLLGQSFAAFEDWRDEVLEQEALERHKHARKIVREQHWVVHGVSGRRKRNVRRLKELKTLRAQKQAEKKTVGKANISVIEGRTSGKFVAKLDNVCKSFGGKTIIDHASFKLMRADRLGIVGPNGSGKTTLIKLITGELLPDSGKIELGVNLEPLIIDQNRRGLDPDTTLKQALVDGDGDSVMIGAQQKHVMAYMKDFLFLPEQMRTPVHALSGGERARVELARGLRKPSNLLILDEPTNDLDLETLDLLQELIADYKGTVILVSHDRDFLDRTVTTTLAYEGAGKWQIYAGGYTDMTRQRGFGVKAKSSDGVKSTSSKPSKSATRKPANKPKLSYKHKYRLETLPGEIEKLEVKLKDMQKEFENPQLYQADPQRFNTLAKALEQGKAQITTLEDELLELEILQEDAES